MAQIDPKNSEKWVKTSYFCEKYIKMPKNSPKNAIFVKKAYKMGKNAGFCPIYQFYSLGYYKIAG
jgi:hypothetical protein